eukprot:1150170-Pelagomonas_calceolata.AAC.6
MSAMGPVYCFEGSTPSVLSKSSPACLPSTSVLQKQPSVSTSIHVYVYPSCLRAAKAAQQAPAHLASGSDAQEGWPPGGCWGAAIFCCWQSTHPCRWLGC